jgi:OPA family glycerol-3-phosphate transporter-like MFS transporter
MGDSRTTRWQRITLATLFVGYAGYYVCRSNLSVATPLLLDEYKGSGITKADIGKIATIGVLVYAIGKAVNGLLGDFLGGRGLFLAGMVASVACTFLFGVASGLAVFAVIWGVNRFVQSMGWNALMKIASRWYPVSIHATVMGVLSLSYLLGDAAARLYLGVFIGQGVGWRGLFLISGLTLAAIAAVSFFTLKSSPRDVGAEEPPANPDNLYGTAGEAPQAESLGRLLAPLLGNLTFWLVCVMNVGLTLIRETFNFWTPTYLKEAASLDEGAAARASGLFPLVGALSALAAGRLSDRLQGRHGLVAFPALVLLIGSLVVLGLVPTQGRPVLALGLVGGVAFFLMAPYSFCSGVIALDLGGKKGSSTAAGLIDCAGYLGATLSGWGMGALAQWYGWNVAFLALAGAALLTALATVLYGVRQELAHRRRARVAEAARALAESPVKDLVSKPAPLAGGDRVQRDIRGIQDESGSPRGGL